jgi:hypothetical protein
MEDTQQWLPYFTEEVYNQEDCIHRWGIGLRMNLRPSPTEPLTPCSPVRHSNLECPTYRSNMHT